MTCTIYILAPRSIVTNNVIPFGCDAVIAIKLNGKYHICIHERSTETVNYPESLMAVPSFGFGSIKNTSNPISYSFFREYSEELFDRVEMASPDSYNNPEWFYDQFSEIESLLLLKQTGKFKLLLTGCGFDVVGGFFNISLLAVIDDEMVSNNIYSKCKGNWETSNNNIQFITIDDPLLAEHLLDGKITPSSAFAISRSIDLLR